MLKKNLIIWLIISFLFSIWSWFWYNYYKIKNEKPIIAKIDIENWKDSKIIKNNWNNKKDDSKELKKWKKYILLSWLPLSAKIQSTLIVLYDIEDKTFNYFPFNYYVDKYKDKKDTGLWYLEGEEILDFFKNKWLNVIDFIEFDKDIVYKLFIENMNNDDEKYIINYITKDWEKKSIPIPSKEWFFELLAKMNTSNFQNLENLQHQFILLLKDKGFLKEYIDWNIENTNLYQQWKLLSLTEKNFPKKLINGKTLSVDENYDYLNALINWTVSDYIIKRKKEIKEIKEIKEDPIIKKKKTLKEKIAELKSKKKKSLKEKLLEQRNKNK